MSPMSEQEYTAQRLDDQIGWFDRRSGENQSRFKLVKLVEIAAAAAVPVLVALELEAGAAVSGALVAVLSGFLLLYKFDENWTSYRATWSALEREKMLHETRTGPYADDATRYELLVGRVEAILAAESKAWMAIRSTRDEPE